MPELGGDITNPQSLNRYAYALNNPTTLNDPSGMDPSGCTTQVDQNGNPYVSCSGADSVTVTASVGPSDALGAIGPGDPLLEAIWEMDSCDMWHNCDGLTSGPDSGGGVISKSAPKPAPPQPQRGCAAGTTSSSFGQYLSGATSATSMFGEFLSGLGPDNLTFGPGSVESQMMASSPGVANAVNQYTSGGPSTGLYTFGLSGLWNAGFNPIQQFVGGADIVL